MKHWILVLTTIVWPWAVWAHPGHGNTPLHALMHLIEDHGAWLGLVLVAIVVALGLSFVQSRRGGMPPRFGRKRDDSR